MKLFVAGLLFVWSQHAFAQVLIEDDTIPKFHGDLPIYMFESNDVKYIMIQTTDSTRLMKEYSIPKGNLLKSYQLNSEGYIHGNLFSYDEEKMRTTTGTLQNGDALNVVTIDINGDTVEIEKKINDTIVYNMLIRDEKILEWYRNERDFNSGSYTVKSQKTGTVLIRGQYKSIKEKDIIDLDEYHECLTKYDLNYSFRTYQLETEIPVGKWYYYHDDGNLLMTKEFNWNKCIRGID